MAIEMNSKKKKTVSQKIKKYTRIINFTLTAAAVIMSIYQLIPKEEKIENIDGSVLAESRTPSDTE